MDAAESKAERDADRQEEEEQDEESGEKWTGGAYKRFIRTRVMLSEWVPPLMELEEHVSDYIAQPVG